MEQAKVISGARESEEQAAARVKAIKDLLKVGLRVHVENQMHEILVPVTVCEIGEDGFKIEHRGRKTLSRWEDASFVKHGRRMPILFDNKHCYTHIV